MWFIGSGQWVLVGIWVEPSVIGWNTGFADLAYITATADCLANGTSLDACDPYGRPFTPYSILPGSFLAQLGLGLEHTGVLGIALAWTWIATIGFLSTWVALRWSRSRSSLCVALTIVTIAGIAPPSLLAVERGTIDIAITAAAAIGLLLCVGQSRFPTSMSSAVRQVLAAVLLFLAAIIKYFAVGVFAAFAAPRRWLLLPLISAGAAAIFLLFNFGDLLIAREVSKSDVPSTTRILFSSTTGLVTLFTEDPYAFFPAEDQGLNMTLLRIAGAVIVALWVVLFVWILMKNHVIAAMPSATWYLVVGGGFILAVPYFLGDSNDYRLIGLVLPMSGLLRWIGGSSIGILWFPVALMTGSMVTGSSMIANDYGFILPKFVIVLGDLALAGSIGFCIAVWLSAWLRTSVGSASAAR